MVGGVAGKERDTPEASGSFDEGEEVVSPLQTEDPTDGAVLRLSSSLACGTGLEECQAATDQYQLLTN